MRTALVAGANQGLGLAVVGSVARRLGARADVYLRGRNPDRVRTAAEGLARGGVGVRTAVLDVADAAAMEAVAERLSRRQGGALDLERARSSTFSAMPPEIAIAMYREMERNL